MDPLTVPATPAPAAILAPIPVAAPDDEDVPLGWECANPALQIESWGVQDDSCR